MSTSYKDVDIFCLSREKMHNKNKINYEICQKTDMQIAESSFLLDIILYEIYNMT